MKRFLLLIIGLILSSPIIAQDGQSPITYKSLAIQASTLNSNGDASSATSTSVSSFNGFGSYIDNPASMALTKGSFYSIGWFNQSQDQTDNYLGNQNSSEFSGTTFGNLGLVYKVPTERGSFVVGGGYNLVSKNNNEIFLDAFNPRNSITDLFKQSSSDYNDIAFDAYAIDFRNETSDEVESIFRVDNDDPQPRFKGINQFAEISNQRTIGEISVFASTEIQKNIFVGVSLGVLTGSIKYDRNFQEVDEDNLYADGAIPEDGSNPATDIYSITLTDDLDSDFYAFSARVGAIFKVLPFLSIGASFELPSKAFVTENYFANIDTELDDFTAFLDNSFSSEFEYAITRPAEYNIGATIADIGNVSISASAEYINYSSTKVDLTINTGDLYPSDVAFLKQDEIATNEAIGRDFAAVINFKSHAAYTLNNGVKLIAGYAFYPGKNKTFQFDESVYSGGISFPLTNNISADISGQYSSRNDRSLLYEFENDAEEVISNSVNQTIDRLNILAGVKFRF